MIELNEKADIYAEENVITVLKEAFAKVYADGYRDGYKDCLDHVSVNLRISNTEYVDLLIKNILKIKYHLLRLEKELNNGLITSEDELKSIV